MDKMTIYESSRVVPTEAIRAINAGRLKGKSEINPMWRIKKLTELFGPCGIGWKYEITDTKFVPFESTGEIACFVSVNLYYRDEGEKTGIKWSDPIPGVGGNKFAQKESGGIYVNDECVKMALTDALSVACKALGVGADVYWSADATKYTAPTTETISYDEALRLVPDGFDRPLSVLWKENLEAVKEIGRSGNPREKAAVAVITAEIKKAKAKKNAAEGA